MSRKVTVLVRPDASGGFADSGLSRERMLYYVTDLGSACGNVSERHPSGKPTERKCDEGLAPVAGTCGPGHDKHGLGPGEPFSILDCVRRTELEEIDLSARILLAHASAQRSLGPTWVQ